MEGNSPSLYTTLSILTILSILFCEWSSNQGKPDPRALVAGSDLGPLPSQVIAAGGTDDAIADHHHIGKSGRSTHLSTSVPSSPESRSPFNHTWAGGAARWRQR